MQIRISNAADRRIVAAILVENGYNVRMEDREDQQAKYPWERKYTVLVADSDKELTDDRTGLAPHPHRR
jgi:hypothetical protein